MLRVRTVAAALCVIGLSHLSHRGQVVAQIADQDTGPVEGTIVYVDSIKAGDPTGALWRSAVLPGWGQAYNGQLYKTPIVVGLVGGLAGLAIHSNSQFHTFNEAYLYAVYLDEDPHPFPEFEESYNMYPGVSASTLRSERDRYRRSRNLFVIGALLAYGLNVLDAYVNGHLIGFDVGEDLAFGVIPNVGFPRASVRLKF